MNSDMFPKPVVAHKKGEAPSGRVHNVLLLDQQFELKKWISEHLAYLREATDIDAAKRAGDELGFRVTKQNVFRMRMTMGLRRRKPAQPKPKPTGASAAPRASANTLRALCHAVLHLYEELGEKAPAALLAATKKSDPKKEVPHG